MIPRTPLAPLLLSAHEYTDFAPRDLPAACPEPRRISASGTLRVTTASFDAYDTVHGTLDLTLTTGHTVSLAF